ncbi:molybdenum cofactor biosynthesis protein MoaC [Dyella sp. OK004]|uniref:bifunctional molybdenum cofactor biosynthesis protein MoaC/MoaB n=1 Tax=Dyella sp. OK004 TaxID=1855292 RepID=UPI0008EF730D|nr:bifunctional molybdenum cofactor biosynthesis protein MoaC/MoaB [Dyella sp. OK004]SFS14218.1 molybdenum cofactor biosynthesis protein MoaC [Dyella sp. OK004]
MSEREPRANFHMADVRRKRITARRAVAVGELNAGSAYDAIVEGRLPKGDAIAMAEIAGLQGAKNASQLMPLCHPLPLEYIELQCEPVPERQAIRVYCEVATFARTGVEMEALAGASAALLTLYDLTKPVQPALSLGAIRLLFKEGGKKGLWLHPEGMSEAERQRYRPRAPARLEGVAAAVITLSDRASRGDYEDTSGPLLVERLRTLGADTGPAEVRADDAEPLAARLRELAAADIKLVLCTGGTGLGPRDRAPEALALAADRHVAGIGELFRSESSQHTPLAWLSRADAVLVEGTLVIALPGSAKAVAEGMDILAPILAHALNMAAGGGHA